MKAFLFLLLTALLPAKTWIELAKEADYHKDHPGRKVEDADTHQKRLEYLELQVKTLEMIALGQPAAIMDTALDVENDWRGNFFMAMVGLSQLIEGQIKGQEWDDMEDLLGLGANLRKMVWASEPDLTFFLMAKGTSQTAFQSLPHLSLVRNQKMRKIAFAKLKSHWISNRPLRKDFLLTEKNETRFAEDLAKDTKKFLESVSTDLDSPPYILDPEFPHQLTGREILKLPLDPKKFRVEILTEIKADYQWIRSGKPIAAYLKTLKKRNPRNLEFYRKHPNGRSEFIKDSMGDTGTPTVVHNVVTMTRQQEVAWQWLDLEAEGTAINNKDQLLRLLPATVRDFVKSANVKIDVSNRSITAPKDPRIKFQIESKITVPNLFPN